MNVTPRFSGLFSRTEKLNPAAAQLLSEELAAAVKDNKFEIQREKNTVTLTPRGSDVKGIAKATYSTKGTTSLARDEEGRFAQKEELQVTFTDNTKATSTFAGTPSPFKSLRLSLQA